MPEVQSTFELKRGSQAPEFELPEGGSGVQHDLGSLLEGKNALVVLFACNHCPFVIHLADAIGALADEYLERGAGFVAINSNDAERYPDDAPEKMDAFAAEHGWKFPYLFDESQEVARRYGAACTPDFYVFNGEGELTYAGQFDASRPGNGVPVTGEDLRTALEATLRAGEVDAVDAVPMKPSSGCSIKWRA